VCVCVCVCVCMCVCVCVCCAIFFLFFHLFVLSCTPDGQVGGKVAMVPRFMSGIFWTRYAAAFVSLPSPSPCVCTPLACDAFCFEARCSAIALR
jgi:hypothetical protein